MDLCASTHPPALGLLLRSLRSLLTSIWRAVTLPYAGVVDSAASILTFWLVLVFYTVLPYITVRFSRRASVKRAA